MAQTQPQTATESIGHALTGDASQHTRGELRTATRVLGGVVLAVVLVVVLFLLFGLKAVTMVGLAGTALVMGLLVAYAAGF